NDPRDPDFGVNNLLNYPVILSANAAASVDGTVVSYTLDVQPGTYRVEFFSVSEPDSSGHGEGRTHLSTATVVVGSTPLTTVVVLPEVREGTLLTATASEVQRTTTSEFSAAFRVGPQLPPATVRGRHVFYNGSAFDGYTIAANAADDRAIATDKQALLPGQGAGTFANVISAVQGLSGIMVDLQGMTPGTQVSASDFEFRSGAGGDPSTWGLVPYPPQVSVRRGAGVGGSDGVTLTWTPGLTHTWLEVTVLPTLRTGLEQSDRFYFGSLVGDTGAGSAPLTVSPADFAATRAAVGTTDATVTNRFDHSRDGVVSPADVAIVRFNMARALERINPAAPPTLPAAQEPLLPPRLMKELTT
ncbi:MAG TPA: hypothetical protein VFB66_12635, partial [Tepidisphaeraceae bacterium]|nr:hypothetical protein [Tepidisphaeraceae bacterium]